MQNDFNELSRRYREQMMQMYSRRPDCPPCDPPKPEPPRPTPPRPEPPRPTPPRPEPPRPTPPRPEPPRPTPPRPEPPRPTPPRPEPPRPTPPRPPRPEVRAAALPVAEEETPVILPAEEPELPPIPDNDALPDDTAYDIPETEEEFSEETDYAEDIPESEYNELDEVQEDIVEEMPEEPELPIYIQPVPPALPDDWKAQEEYEQRNNAEGQLQVIAATADSAFPVAEARVTIYTRIGGKLYLNYMLSTNENGETPTVSLPAPDAELSQSPENIQPYSVCDIRIFAKGFFRSEALNVRIFAGVVTRQTFQLVPLPLNMTPEDADIDPTPSGRTDEEVS